MKSSNTFTHRVISKAVFGAAMLVCALLPLLVPAGAPAVEGGAQGAAFDLPTHWAGQPVRPLALSAVEQRFAANFPGRIARLTDGRQIVVLRQVARPTRMLHPAADCYRGLGYAIEGEGLQQIAHAAPGAVQRCFTARKGGVALRVCEQIEDARGRVFADTSAWYWAAALGQSPGPWRAVTVTQPLGAEIFKPNRPVAPVHQAQTAIKTGVM